MIKAYVVLKKQNARLPNLSREDTSRKTFVIKGYFPFTWIWTPPRCQCLNNQSRISD